jgi:hypothetical protein
MTRLIFICFAALIAIHSLKGEWIFSSRSDIGAQPKHILSKDGDELSVLGIPDISGNRRYSFISGSGSNWTVGDTLSQLPTQINSHIRIGDDIYLCGYSSRPDDPGNGIYVLRDDKLTDISVDDKYGDDSSIEFTRSYNAIKNYGKEIYVFSHAIDISEFRVENGVTYTTYGTVYNELWKIEDNELINLFQVPSSSTLHFRDFVKDNEDKFWFSVWDSLGLVSWKNDFEIIDLYGDTHRNTARLGTSIEIKDETIHVVTQHDPFASLNKEARVFQYDINNASIESTIIPEYTMTDNKGNSYTYDAWDPVDTKIADNSLYINLRNTLVKYSNGDYTFYNVLEMLRDHISPSLFNHTTITDYTWHDSEIVLATSWGILTNDDFTSVSEENPYHVNDFSLYPSMAGQGETVNIESPEGLAIERIRLISIEGRAVDMPRPAISGGRATLQVPPAAPGNYAVVIETEAGAYLKQLVVE